MTKINGVIESVQDVTVGEYLRQKGYNLTRIAVEMNGEILPKAKYDVTVIKDGDVIEIVGFVGGG